MNRLAIGCCVAVLATATPVFAQSTLIVDDDGGGSIASCDDPAAAFATIGAAIGAAANGDTVLVCPGTYVENLDFAGKSIAVRSVAGPAVTVVDGNQADAVVTFASSEGHLRFSRASRFAMAGRASTRLVSVTEAAFVLTRLRRRFAAT